MWLVQLPSRDRIVPFDRLDWIDRLSKSESFRCKILGRFIDPFFDEAELFTIEPVKLPARWMSLFDNDRFFTKFIFPIPPQDYKYEFIYFILIFMAGLGPAWFAIRFWFAFDSKSNQLMIRKWVNQDSPTFDFWIDFILIRRWIMIRGWIVIRDESKSNRINIENQSESKIKWFAHLNQK